ncbi:MAG: hypothetical protein CTY31_12815 [Hyphomicrobium sp.]|nr:MAG: hypothetical protein CTY31_12815 [Hyphomicrobium sp.]
MVKHAHILALFGAAILTAGAAQAGSLKDEGPAHSGCSGGAFAGHYIGANIGYVSHDAGVSNDLGDSFSYDESGFTGGIHYGYNIQCGRFVVGMESDFSLTDADARFTDGDEFIEDKVDWLSTSRLRIGLAHDNILFYITGGLATAKIEHSLGSAVITLSEDDVEWGWTAGGGVEMIRNGGWSVRAEALYADFSDETVQFDFGLPVEYDNELWIGRIGLSYQYDLGAILGRVAH